jgi:hypothetical protein
MCPCYCSPSMHYQVARASIGDVSDSLNVSLSQGRTRSNSFVHGPHWVEFTGPILDNGEGVQNTHPLARGSMEIQTTSNPNRIWLSSPGRALGEAIEFNNSEALKTRPSDVVLEQGSRQKFWDDVFEFMWEDVKQVSGLNPQKWGLHDVCCEDVTTT